jgi:hypothetical protein
MAKTLGSSYYAQFATPEGVLRLYLDLKVDLDEMKTWEPARIEQFFEGMAMAAHARFDTGVPSVR